VTACAAQPWRAGVVTVRPSIVYVDEAWQDKVGPAEPMEQDMLDFASDVRPNSRLWNQTVNAPARVEMDHVLSLSVFYRP
jgi:hypothetical protein